MSNDGIIILMALIYELRISHPMRYASDGLPTMGEDYETQLENLMDNNQPPAHRLNPQTGSQEPPSPWLTRLTAEHWELDKKGMALTQFMREDPKFKELPERDQFLMARQARVMADYFAILTERIWRAEHPEMRDEADKAQAEKLVASEHLAGNVGSGGTDGGA